MNADWMSDIAWAWRIARRILLVAVMLWLGAAVLGYTLLALAEVLRRMNGGY